METIMVDKEAYDALVTALKRAYHALPLESRTKEACKNALLACGVEV